MPSACKSAAEGMGGQARRRYGGFETDGNVATVSGGGNLPSA